MSDNFTVTSSLHNYDVHFVDKFSDELSQIIEPGDVLLIDKNVFSNYERQLEQFTSNAPHVLITATEENKSYYEVGKIIELVIQTGLRKNNKIIAIGGGIVQDIATFIAANVYRGISWYFFPTTLLSMADSCIGGKSSINFLNYKNLLGNFYPPMRIFIDASFIDTLPRKEIISGLGEMTHFYFVSGESDFQLISSQYQKALEDHETLESLIRRSLLIKKATIEIDEFDQKERRLFNYGHSFGHAIESVTNYRIPHGIAVSHGMDIANFISMKLGLIDENLRLKMREVLQFNWHEVDLGDIDPQNFISALRKDKKNIGSDVRVILTRGLGQMFITSLDIDRQAGNWIHEYFKEQAYTGI